MKKRALLTSAAGLVAAAALIGGTTFAQWSDTYTDENNQVGAGMIKLGVNDWAVQNFDKMNLIPGEEADYEFIVTSMESNATGNSIYIPRGDLSLKVQDLLGTEDGQTTLSELEAGGIPFGAGTDPDGVSNWYGEFDDQAEFIVNVTGPVASSDPATVCGSPLLTSINPVGGLRSAAGLTIDLLPGSTVLAPGDSVCVKMIIQLPFASTTNASQGDSAAFDVRFDLTQVPTP